MDFTRSNLFALLNKFEEAFKDADFSHGKTNFYPVVKIQYAYQLHLLIIKGFPEALGKSAINPVRLNIARRIYYKLIFFILWIKSNLQVKQTTPVLITGFREHITDKLLSGTGELTNPFTEPFEKILEEHSSDFKSLIIDNIFMEPGFEVDPKLQIRLRNLIEENLGNNSTLINNLRKVELFSTENNITLNGLADFLFRNIVDNETYFQFLRLSLKGSSYKTVLNSVYYNNQVMALTRAAKTLGIKVIEYQHSLQSDEHFAYGEWKFNTKNAEDYFPDIFWVWRNSDKLRTEKNFGFFKNKVNAFLGGNVYLAFIADQIDLQHTKRNNGILVALQGTWIPSYIEQSIANNPQYTWYLRLHPRYQDDKLNLEKLKMKYPDRVEIEDANALSLYKLFSKVRFNITAFSGTALEAQAFGVQNIIFGTDGYKAYEPYIKDGAFLYVTNSDELDGILCNDHLTFKTYDTMLIDPEQVRKNVISYLSANN